MSGIGYGHAAFPGGNYAGAVASQQQQASGNPYLQFQQQQQQQQQQQYHQGPRGHAVQGSHYHHPQHPVPGMPASANHGFSNSRRTNGGGGGGGPKGFVPAAGSVLAANEAFFYCDPCHAPFESAQELQQHFATAHQAVGEFDPRMDYFVCAACNRAFGSAHAAGDHHRSVHGGVIAKVDRNRGVGAPLGAPEEDKDRAAQPGTGGNRENGVASEDTFMCGVCRRTDFPSAFALSIHASEAHGEANPSQTDVLVCGACALAFRDADSHAGHWAHHHARMGDIDMGRPVSASFSAGGKASISEETWIERLASGAAVSGMSTLAVVDFDSWSSFADQAASVVPTTHAVAVVHRAGARTPELVTAIQGKGFLVEAPSGAGCESAILLKVGAWTEKLAPAGVSVLVASSNPIVSSINGHNGVRVITPGTL